MHITGNTENNFVQSSYLNISRFTLLKVHPFLKWAGGKGQLIKQLAEYLPEELGRKSIRRYIEPFIGGGALFFFIAQTYRPDELFINDVNPELILAYKTIQKDVKTLITILDEQEKKYHKFSEEHRKEYFYQIRKKYNSNINNINYSIYSSDWLERTAELIFLNRTCFNGLFRVNSKGEFNVPYGKYLNPKICDSENLLGVADLLQNTVISRMDYTFCDELVDNDSFVYFDPPYRPLSVTSSFTSYSSQEFNDNEQIRLAKFFSSLNNKGGKLMLSNSDPKNTNPTDTFFDDLYGAFNIHRIDAYRNINSKSDGRGQIKEILVLNY